MTADFNNAFVGPALDSVMVGLRPFVENEFRTRFGPTWQNEIKQTLRQDAEWQRMDGDLHLDAHVLLKLIHFRWNDIFRNKFEQGVRNYVNSLLDMRNQWAHQRRLTAEDAFRTVYDAERLLVAVSASDMESITRLKGRLMEIIRGGSTEGPTRVDRPQQIDPLQPGPAYRPLFEYLQSQTVDEIQLTFGEIEGILGRPLPPAARTYNAWWGNDGRGQAKAWMGANRRTKLPRIKEERVAFVRA